jgi:hypothetical protein
VLDREEFMVDILFHRIAGVGLFSPPTWRLVYCIKVWVQRSHAEHQMAIAAQIERGPGVPRY